MMRKSGAARCASLAVLAVSAVSTGCGGSDQAATPPAQAADAPAQTSTPTPAPAETATPVATATATSRPAAHRVSRARAIAIARKVVGGGRVSEVDRDDEDGRAVWKVKIKRGSVEHKLSVAVSNGRVLKHERDRDDGDDNDGGDD